MAESKEKQAEAIVIPPVVEEMVRELRERTEGQGDGNPGQMALDIVEQILTAASLEDASGQTSDLSGMLEIPLLVNLRAWQPSDLGEFGVFAVLECVDGFDLENKKIVTCGGKNVVAMIYRAEKENRLPMKAQFREVETRSGFHTLWIDVLPE